MHEMRFKSFSVCVCVVYLVYNCKGVWMHHESMGLHAGLPMHSRGIKLDYYLFITREGQQLKIGRQLELVQRRLHGRRQQDAIGTHDCFCC